MSCSEGSEQAPARPRRAPPGRAVYRIQAPILESARLPGGHHRLVVRAPAVAGAARPGQFLHVWCHDPATIGDPPAAAVLRRPYSISRVWSQEAVEILLRVRGVGGRILAGRRVGESLDVIGPLGHGFHIPEGLRLAVIVAGGSGLAPVPFLIETLVARGARVILLAGAADDEQIPFAVDRPSDPDRPALSPSVPRPEGRDGGRQGDLATSLRMNSVEGTLGVRKGGQPGHATLLALEALGAEVTFVSEAVEGLLVSDLLAARLEELSGDGEGRSGDPPPSRAVMAIGPRAMLKRLHELTRPPAGLPLQVSLEERMACGLGACRSCVVPVVGEQAQEGAGPRSAAVVYRTVCRDGPVFHSPEIAWELLDT